MYRNSQDFRTILIEDNKTGWKCDIYQGDNKIGHSSYHSEDESYSHELSEAHKDLILSLFENQEHMIIDNEPLKWTIELAIIAMIENEKELNYIRKEVEKGTLIAKLKEHEQFIAFNVEDTPENRASLLEAYNVEMFGTELLN